MLQLPGACPCLVASACTAPCTAPCTASVLTPRAVSSARSDTRRFVSSPQGELEVAKLERLRQICDLAHAKVVLSSDWRRQPGLKRRAIETLFRHGIECIGATPMRALHEHPVRPLEISEWLRDHGQGVTRWVAIDDRDLLLERGGIAMAGHFVHTSFYSGLTPNLAEQVLHLLLPHVRTGIPIANCGDGMLTRTNRIAHTRESRLCCLVGPLLSPPASLSLPPLPPFPQCIQALSASPHLLLPAPLALLPSHGRRIPLARSAHPGPKLKVVLGPTSHWRGANGPHP